MVLSSPLSASDRLVWVFICSNSYSFGKALRPQTFGSTTLRLSADLDFIFPIIVASAGTPLVLHQGSPISVTV